MQATIHDSIADIERAEWNALVGADAPFMRHEFLTLAEQCGCVSAAQGWRPQPITITDNGELTGALPLYEKMHSWGEFVFDWAWADAYTRAGLDYYPKLVAAAPFTPAPSQRLLLRDPSDQTTAKKLLKAALDLAESNGYSSLHIQFPNDSETSLLRDSGFLIRNDCQFHWHNDDYRSFDDFVKTFTASKRKKARRDRRRVAEQGISFRRLTGHSLDAATWSKVCELTSRTFLMRGHAPYFNESFFIGLGEQLPDNILVIAAELDDQMIAAAVFFVGSDTLYGRYWGSRGHYDALHFEACYYQGIDFCIEKGLSVFQPGTQGEHKIARGFTPATTHSAHWLAHPEFADAIAEYLRRESTHIDQYMDAVDQHSPYKKDSKG